MKRIALLILFVATFAAAQTPTPPATPQVSKMAIGDLRTRLWTIEQMIAGERLDEAQRYDRHPARRSRR